jgi:hypothetical protein
MALTHFGQPAPWRRAFDPGPFKASYARGAIPCVDIDTSYAPDGTRTLTCAQVASGNYDAMIAGWATEVAALGHPIFLLLDVEMNGPWEPYSADPGGYIAMWKQMRTVFERHGATNVSWVWCPNVDAGNHFRPMSEYWPGADQVDWVGLDGFNQGGQSWDAIFKTSYDKLVALAPGKPMMISQTGAKEDPTMPKPAWISDMFAKLPSSYNAIKALLWFNWRIYENNAWFDWPIESSAAATQAFRTGIAASRYLAGGSYGSLPFGKVPLP